MAYTTSRGIAGERAAIREEQREVARRREREASQKHPTLDRSESSVSSGSSIGSGDTDMSLPKFQFLKPSRPDALPLKMENCLDMAPIKKGSFLFMSTKYVEADDWIEYEEELRLDSATF
ncbi:uncharacterized protein F4822DRAFT_430329 [Hypoxylon trugodes]|uniref:uncharacterized protein n=1 Tax=Hypoxylon trugodes TaxID=326681 RepID=UPI00218E0B87|nr:uncharacterized protein F4822DRAFT_430329 [Hypoxylon trugodes]KAI1387581.1 hypothetical protein F4822DRAFT_430329 [Hypoxylon trugodes]